VEIAELSFGEGVRRRPLVSLVDGEQLGGWRQVRLPAASEAIIDPNKLRD
jgi:hypothetical protein